MGYMRHNAIIVTAAGYMWNDSVRLPSDPPAPDIDAFRASLPPAWRALVIGPIRSIVNGYMTFAFMPDGSKEDWPDSDLGDEYRQRFVDLFSYAYDDGSTPYDVLVIGARFGGDEPGAGYEPMLKIVANPHTPDRAIILHGDPNEAADEGVPAIESTP